MNCWEHLKCLPTIYRTCPAYPDRGTDCWKVTGTKCDQGRHEMKSVEEKIAYCRTCDFYKKYARKF